MTLLEELPPIIARRFAASGRLPRAPDPSYHESVASLASLVGHECTTPNFTQAIAALSRTYGLPLDPFDIDVIGLLKTGLSRAPRFRHSLHLSHERREQSGTHAIMCVPLHFHFCKLAGLGADREDEEARILREVPACGDLFHDDGEQYGEFSSLDQRSREPGRENDHALEREIVVHAASWAIASAAQSNYGAFYAMQSRVIAAAGIMDGSRAPSAEHVRGVLLANPAPELTEEQRTNYLERYLAWYDIAEVIPGFLKVYGKLKEHLQGTRHATLLSAKHPSYSPQHLLHAESGALTPTLRARFAENPPYTVPMAYGEHARLGSVLHFSENGMGELFAAAKTPAQQALASVLRDGVYQSIVEFLCGSLYIWDRTVRGPSPFVASRVETLDDRRTDGAVRQALADAISDHHRLEQLRLLREERSLGNRPAVDADGMLRARLTRGQLIRLYCRALEIGFVPEAGADPLAVQDVLPVELRGFDIGSRHQAIARAQSAVVQRQKALRE